MLGLLATGAGRTAEAAVHLDTALALADACATPFERALTLLAQAETVQDGAWARNRLEEARAIGERLGAARLLARVDGLAARLAAPARPTYRGGLSAREVEVALLIAQGSTNRQIADALFISELTADTHVRNILHKLEFSSRAQVAAWTVGQGLVPPASG